MRTGLAACAVAAFAVVLSGCGARQDAGPAGSTPGPATQTTTTTPTVASEPPTTEGTADDKCTAADLTGVVQPGDAAAGNRYATLVVTNASDAPCSLYGYGGLQLVGANGQPNPTILTRQPDPGPAAVSLPPGGQATKKLHWVVVPTGDEPADGPCQPESTGATVIPPDDTQSFSVTFAFGSVCNKGTIDGSAYFAG